MGLSVERISVREQIVSDTNPFPVVTAAPSSTNTAGYNPSISFARTADTSAYNAGDVIGINNAGSPGSAIHSFTSFGPAGGNVIITGAYLRIDASSVPAGMTNFRLHLYDASPTAILDNAVWDLPSGDRTAYLGYIDLGTPVDVGSTLFVQFDQINKQLKLASAVTTIYGELVTNGGFTPASGTVFTIRLRVAAL